MWNEIQPQHDFTIASFKTQLSYVLILIKTIANVILLNLI